MTAWETRGNHAVQRVLAGRSNAFLLSSGSARILVDTGRGNRWAALERRLAEAGVDRLDALILTHAHFDHAENARRVRTTYGAKVIIQEAEAGFLERGDAPLPAGSVLLTRVFTSRLRKLLQPRFLYDGCPVDLAVTDRFDLAPFGFGGYLLHTPGHCRGAMSVVLDDEIALVGDTMVNAGPWSVFPPFADDVGLLLDSWRRLLETGCRLFLPGHGAAIGRPLLERRFEERRGRSVPTATGGP
jgi:hydroxyacylglutathione hydrolase